MTIQWKVGKVIFTGVYNIIEDCIYTCMYVHHWTEWSYSYSIVVGKGGWSAKAKKSVKYITLLLCIYTVSSSQRETVLKWKFAHYDRIDDNVLQYSEEFLFHKEVFDLFGCFKVYDHIRELTNVNGDSVISEDEWLAFFVPQPGTVSTGTT